MAVDHRPEDPRRPPICLDEASRQRIGEVREPLPPAPGRVERYDSVSVRNGVANLFLAFEPLAGWREVAVTDTRQRGDWAHFVHELVEGRYREAERVVLILDQLNTHSAASLYEAFPPDKARRITERLEVPHTPKHGSWLHMAESELSARARDLPERVGDREAMVRHVGAWKTQRNEAGVKANWRFTTADARIKRRKLYPTIDA